MLLQEVTCRWCGKVFCVCQSCWRGQCYCGKECRRAAKRQAHRKAELRYRRTEKGKKSHREAEKRRRMGLTKKNKKTMDDTGTLIPISSVTIARVTKSCNKRQVFWEKTISMRTCRCHFCGSVGVIVNQFPRRSYGSVQRHRKWHFADRIQAKG